MSPHSSSELITSSNDWIIETHSLYSIIIWIVSRTQGSPLLISLFLIPFMCKTFPLIDPTWILSRFISQIKQIPSCWFSHSFNDEKAFVCHFIIIEYIRVWKKTGTQKRPIFGGSLTTVSRHDRGKWNKRSTNGIINGWYLFSSALSPFSSFCWLFLDGDPLGPHNVHRHTTACCVYQGLTYSPSPRQEIDTIAKKRKSKREKETISAFWHKLESNGMEQQTIKALHQKWRPSQAIVYLVNNRLKLIISDQSS